MTYVQSAKRRWKLLRVATGQDAITDEYAMELPDEGDYRIEIGLYVAKTGQRLQVVQGGRILRRRGYGLLRTDESRRPVYLLLEDAAK